MSAERIRPLGRPAVLVCDDEEIIGLVCGRALTLAGYETTYVRCGRDAIRAVERQAFDVLVLDVRLPDVSGPAVLAATHEHDRDLPCVIMSGYAAFSDAVECLRHGAVNFLSKPFEMDSLVRAVDHALASTHLRVDSALVATTHVIFSSLDARQIGRRVLEVVGSLLKVDLASITLGGEDGAAETFRIGASAQEGEVIAMPRLGRRAWRRITESRDPIVLSREVAADTQWLAAFAAEAHTVLAQRLSIGDRTLGVLWVARKEGARAFGDRDLRRMVLLAGHVALALDNARLHAATEAQARTIEQALDRLSVAERVATAARLASGIGHEIANPACAVRATLEGARRRVQSGRAREADEAIGQALLGIGTILDICEALGPLAARSGQRDQAVALRRILETAMVLAQHELRPRARLAVEIPSELPVLRADPAKLVQVFLNLLLNAAQAIEPGVPDDNVVSVRVIVEVTDIVVRIEDTGRGVPVEILPRLFQPSVTTKLAAEGHGVGLAMCRWILEELGGSIHYLPNSPRGAVFESRLPLPALAPQG